MIYGEEKVRQMVRSILPSAGAKTARDDKKSLNRRLRRNARQALHKIRGEEEWDDDNTDFWDDGQSERTYIVSRRRGDDKLRHFENWAENKAKYIPDGFKMGYIKGLIGGKGVIIDHAYSHLENLDGFTKDVHLYRSSYRYPDDRKVLTKGKVRSTIQGILEDSWAHASLNRVLKHNVKTVGWYTFGEYISHYTKDGEPVKTEGFRPVYKRGIPTLLLGAHNADEFVAFYTGRALSPSRIKGDGIHYHMGYGGKYSKVWLPNPKAQYHLHAVFRTFIEAYIDSDGSRIDLMQVELNVQRRSYDKRRYHGSVSRDSKYRWE
jgi:hypothetical protein